MMDYESIPILPKLPASNCGSDHEIDETVIVPEIQEVAKQSNNDDIQV